MPKRSRSLNPIPDFSHLSLHREPMNWAGYGHKLMKLKSTRNASTNSIAASQLPHPASVLDHNAHLLNHLRELQQDFKDHLRMVVQSQKEHTDSLKDHLNLLQQQIANIRSTPHVPVPIPVQALAAPPPPPPPPTVLGRIKPPPLLSNVNKPPALRRKPAAKILSAPVLYMNELKARLAKRGVIDA